MKTKLQSSFILLLIFQVAYTQTAYYDALSIKNNFIDVTAAGFTFKQDPASISEIAKILKGYLPPAQRNDQTFSESLVFNEYRSPMNPYIGRQAAASIAGASAFPAGILSLLSGAGELDVTNLADGFAKFLVERTKEELNVAFFEKFKKRIHEPGFDDALILFPQTCSTLDAISDQIYNYEAYIGALRESFESDINGLLTNLPTAIKDGRYCAYFTAHSVLKSTCLGAAYIGDGLLKKVHPGQILADFDVTMLNGFNSNVQPAIQTIQLFSESFRSKGTDHYWLDKDSVGILLSDPIALKIYFGLVYQKSGALPISFGKNTLQSVLSGSVPPSSITNANTFIKGFIAQTSALTQNIRNLVGKDKDKLTFPDYYAFYISAIDVIEYTKKINTFPGLNALVLGSEFDKFLQMARTGGNVALAINRKNYSSVIINTYQLYSFAFTSVPGDKMNSKFKDFLLRYGSFVASVAQAQNSDDVKKAIEAAALPSGSSRIKRETPFNVSLNAYTGLYGGWEKINGLDNNFKFNSFGVTAPIGISISRGHSIFFFGTGKSGWSKGKKGWSTSLFLSVVDIGALTAFRFNNDSTAINDTTKAIASQAPNIKLKDIISPGAFLSIGIPKSPLSVNLGAQMGANLRNVKSTNNSAQLDFSNNMYWRFSISLCVDIPLLNFYTSSR